MQSEDDVKGMLAKWLQSQGWKTKIAWGKERGIDIEATMDSERWLIEVKGEGSRTQMEGNYFQAILGEILQRMNDPNARHSVALPDKQRFRNLWAALPSLAKSRTKITALFVQTNGAIVEVN